MRKLMYRLDEAAVADDERGGCRAVHRFGGAERVAPRCKIDVPRQKRNERRDDVVHERVHDGAKGAAQNDAYRELYGIALGGELPEFAEKARLLPS